MYFCKKLIMKKIYFLFAIIATGCTSVHFDNAMPEKSKSLKAFPTDIIGKYYYADSLFPAEKNQTYYNARYFGQLYKQRDSVHLCSADFFISKTCAYYSTADLAYFDITKTDTTGITSRHNSAKKRMEGKYLIFEESTLDTLLNLQKEDVLKATNGTYYFNHFIQKNDWEISQFETKKDNSYSFNITNKEDADELKKYVIDTSRKYNELVHVTDKAFQDFADKGGFRSKFKLKKYPAH